MVPYYRMHGCKQHIMENQSGMGINCGLLVPHRISHTVYPMSRLNSKSIFPVTNVWSRSSSYNAVINTFYFAT